MQKIRPVANLKLHPIVDLWESQIKCGDHDVEFLVNAEPANDLARAVQKRFKSIRRDVARSIADEQNDNFPKLSSTKLAQELVLRVIDFDGETGGAQLEFAGGERFGFHAINVIIDSNAKVVSEAFISG